MTILCNNQEVGSLMFNNVLGTDNEVISIKGFIICTISGKLDLEDYAEKIRDIRNIVTEKDVVKIYVDMPKIFRMANIAELLCTLEKLKNIIGYRLNKIGFINYELQFY